ncbi:hypothetical protein G9A89_016458 [Geosiphon pyriformis]|nr:hypothetical protein G9A89_016458 [Geosiphon pyriformis]
MAPPSSLAVERKRVKATPKTIAVHGHRNKRRPLLHLLNTIRIVFASGFVTCLAIYRNHG